MLLARAGLRRPRRRPQPLRRRHALHPRPHARRRPPAPPLGPARPHRRRRHAAGPPRPRSATPTTTSRVTIKPSHGVDALYAPRRTVLDPILVDAAVAAGADVRYGITVTDVAPRRRRSGRRRSSGRDDDRRSRSASTPAAWSAPTASARRVAERGRRPGRAHAAPAPAPSSTATGRASTPTATSGSSARTPAPALIPTNDGQTCVFAGATPAAASAAAASHVLDDVVRRGVARHWPTGSRAGAAPRRRAHASPGVPGYLRRPWGPGWALVGDAGYWKDPISAHGLTDALRDAELLARAVVGAHDRRRPPSATRSPATRPPATGSRSRLFDVVDAIAGQRLDRRRDRRPPAATLSAAMADEVDALAALEPLASAHPMAA